MSRTLAALHAVGERRESEAMAWIASGEVGRILDGLRFLQLVYGMDAPEVHAAIATVPEGKMAIVRALARERVRPTIPARGRS